MRRIAVFTLALVLFFTLTFPAAAAASASSFGAYATVSQDGSCQVSMTVRLHLDQVLTDLTFPVPKQATNVTLNGARVRTQVKNDSLLIDLSKKLGTLVGDITVTVGYTLPDVIYTSDAGLLTLQVPLLSGFAYPVDTLEFSVTLPGAPEAKPAFSSGYHQADIEKDLTYSISGATISGTAQKSLKDHETLVMTLTVSEDMFPQTGVVLPDLQVLNITMAVCAVLALLYWLFTLRAAPPRRTVRPIPPEGCTAGERGTLLTLEGADLSMMVFSWAQLGYLLIKLDRHDRVTLHKRMDMGNERGSFEQRWFKQLFGKRDLVDTAGSRYAELAIAVKKQRPNVQSFLRSRSGIPRLFRAMAAMVGLFGGVSLGISLSTGAALQWLLVCILAALGTLSSFAIQQWAYCLFLANKRRLWSALVHCGVWAVLGLLGGIPAVGILVPLSQLLAGLMAAYGGRRTDAGRQAMSQVLGLRRYLRSVQHPQLLQLCENDPDYFHTLAPYALALGVDASFAKRFGKLRLPTCPYLATGTDSMMTASEWSVLMRRTVAAMNAGQTQRLSGKLPILRGLSK